MATLIIGHVLTPTTQATTIPLGFGGNHTYLIKEIYMKRTALVLASLGFSTFAFASLAAASSPTEVTVPQLPGGFFIGGTGLYLQPSLNNGDLDYAAIRNRSVSTGANLVANPKVVQVEPGYDWGWGVNLGYEFPQTGNDINLSYIHLDTKDSDSVTANPQDLTEINPNPVPFVSISYTTGSATAKIDLDQVDLTMGQALIIGQRLAMHPIAGLRYADIDRTIQSNFDEPDRNGATRQDIRDIFSVTNKSDFSGIGPLVGTDLDYYLGNGFSIVGHTDAGVLIGNIKSNTNANDFTPSLSQTLIVTINKDSHSHLTPVADAKLGAAFTYHFSNTNASYLTVEAGYQGNEYFNAIETLRPDYLINAASPQTQNANLLLDGPYANITVHV